MSVRSGQAPYEILALWGSPHRLRRYRSHWFSVPVSAFPPTHKLRFVPACPPRHVPLSKPHRRLMNGHHAFVCARVFCPHNSHLTAYTRSNTAQTKHTQRTTVPQHTVHAQTQQKNHNRTQRMSPYHNIDAKHNIATPCAPIASTATAHNMQASPDVLAIQR